VKASSDFSSTRILHFYELYKSVDRTTTIYSSREFLVEGPYVEVTSRESAFEATSPLRAAYEIYSFYISVRSSYTPRILITLFYSYT
jgi:hypothetical protein